MSQPPADASAATNHPLAFTNPQLKHPQDDTPQPSEHDHKKPKLTHNPSPLTSPSPFTTPPLLDYSLYTHYPDIQTIFHHIGGPSLPYRSAVLDLSIEKNLLCDYRTWVLAQLDSEETDDAARGFLKGLYEELWTDFEDVKEEVRKNDGRWGRSGRERVELRRWVKHVGRCMGEGGRGSFAGGGGEGR